MLHTNYRQGEISEHRVNYSFERHLKIGKNVENDGDLKVATAVEGKHLIFECKINRKKTVII